MSSNNLTNNIKHYAAVLRDLQTERDDLDTQINWVELRLETLKRQLQPNIVTIEETPKLETVPKRKPFEPLSPGESLADQCYLILEEQGEPMHASVIVDRLKEYKRYTSPKSVSGVMPQDKKKRFELLGNNIWALQKWPSALKDQFKKDKVKWVSFKNDES